MELVFGETLCESNQVFPYIYFPLSAVIALVAPIQGRAQMELTMIGSEGMLGAVAVLGIDKAPVRGIVHSSGTALRISAEDFTSILQARPAVRTMASKYLFVLIAQAPWTTTCAHFHEIEPRLARWLLVSQDRAHADQFHLTHQFLADMLGVQRSAVTIAAGALQKRKIISYSRGKIKVLSRAGLEEVSCECYQQVAAIYEEMFPPH